MLERANRSALLVLFVGALAGCHKGGGGPAPSGTASASASAAPAAPAGSAGGACDVVSCLNFSAPGLVTGQAVDLPGVPPPPPGAVLCGGTQTLRANYYTTTQKPEDVIAYYEKLLPAQGFTLKGPHGPGNKACSLTVSFHKKRLELGNVFAYVGGFSVSYFGN
jgi:hypothetical protein